ncbi:short-chain-enoyl-CoA hydratase [Colletotrichum spaethianum]|uniref:Short-chain-enoyl-CoA hydratase n=1 Tax=Colletotrichum spaethianum TaxID=700344 RepID=A0AA37PDY8_9PEZI|nr:short-chain-enoyl-CoA hydratase [Colletotrichum spaethianum]GKT50439.1 short-chain-enoyl-CoA hydratase [Colletotrichum spaethianum]
MSSKRIVLITGANTGIGYETVRALLESKRSYHIIFGSRSIDKGKAAIAELEKEFPSTTSSLELIQIDVVDDDSILKAFQEVKDKHGAVDVLNYNPEDIKTLRQNLNKSYDVNTSGTHVLTHVFIPLLLKSSDPRILFITSGLSDLHSTEALGLTPFQPQTSPPAGWPKPFFMQVGYRSSKTALNMIMQYWHWILKADGVKVWCISPGFLATGLGGNPELLKKMGAGEPSQGGILIKQVVEGERDADVGKVVNKDGIQSW